MAEALRTTYWVPQIGSKLARSACGTKRSARAAARWEMAGVANSPAAMAPAAVFKNALRCMMPSFERRSTTPSAGLRALRDPPEERQWALLNAGDAFAPSLILQEETRRRIDHVFDRRPIEPAHRSLFLVEVCCLIPGVDCGLDLRAGRPAEPRLVAVGTDRRVGRWIDTDRTGMPGVEHLPATLAGGRLLRPARRIGAPVDGSKIDVHAEPPQQVGRHVALGLGDWKILRRKAGDRLTRIAAFRQQTLGSRQISRT